MDRFFVDTNIFLRYLTNDIPAQANAVKELLWKAARGEIALETNTLVIAEIVWTLQSYYELPPEEIKDKVLGILNTPGLRVEDSDLVGRAILLYAEKNVDFIDAYNSCWMRDQGLTEVYTFDARHYKRLEGISPLIPQ